MSHPGACPRARRHADIRQRSYDILQAAREEARKKRGYDSQDTRRIMAEECAKRTSFSPRSEQLDLAECMLLGLDAVSIAGTGWGKTLPFVLPLLVPQSKGKIIVIISPLNALEADQAARFHKMGVSAVALNGTTCTPAVLKEIEQGAYALVVTGPKLLVGEDNAVRKLFSQPKFTRKVLGLVVDEAHCISQWGGEFRPEYATLDVVRALLPTRASVQLASATMPPLVLAEATQTLRVQLDKAFFLNVGNDRSNISWEVRMMAAGKSDLDALALLLPTPDNPMCLTKAMVFFNDILLLMKARRWFVSKLPEALRSRVKGYYARRCELAKTLVMHKFVHGEIDILFTTEAAGMGCDIPDIRLIVQFMAPDSLSTWTQRAGRAGRRPNIQARAVLLLEKSVFSEKGKKTRKDGEPVTYVKEIEAGLRKYAEALRGQCRRDIADEYFDNPPGRVAPTGDCCDNCAGHLAVADSSDNAHPLVMDDPPSNPPSNPPSDVVIDPELLGLNAAVPASDRFSIDNWRNFLTATRCEDDVAVVKKKLIQWRRDEWKLRYSHQPFGSPAVLPDHVINSLASRTAYRVVEDFRELKWLLWSRHASEVLRILDEVDRPRGIENLHEEKAKQGAVDELNAARAREKAEREQERKRKLAETARRQQEREEEQKEKLRQQAEKKKAKEEKKAREAEEKKRLQDEKVAVRLAERLKKQALGKVGKGKRKAEDVCMPSPKRRHIDEKENEDPALVRSNTASAVVPAPPTLARPPPRPRPRRKLPTVPALPTTHLPSTLVHSDPTYTLHTPTGMPSPSVYAATCLPSPNPMTTPYGYGPSAHASPSTSPYSYSQHSMYTADTPPPSWYYSPWVSQPPTMEHAGRSSAEYGYSTIGNGSSMAYTSSASRAPADAGGIDDSESQGWPQVQW